MAYVILQCPKDRDIKDMTFEGFVLHILYIGRGRADLTSTGINLQALEVD